MIRTFFSMVMELFSPRPEYTQLDQDTINPKGQQFQKKPLSSSFNALKSSSNRRNSLSESTGLCFLLPPLPLQTSSINNQISGTLDSSASSFSSSSLSNLQENTAGFPSPPQSPISSNGETKIFNNIKTTSSIPEFNLDKDTILVKPNWDPGLDVSKYGQLTRKFISQYKIFKGKDPMNIPSQREYRYPLRSNKYRDRNEDVTYYYTPTAPQRSSASGTPTTLPDNNKESNTLKQRKKPHVRNISKKPVVYSNNHTTPNISWELLPDYSPSWDTLPTINTNNSMKVEWKGSSIDLSHDPLKDRLHPAELNLAQTLRLSCSLYLDSKRRLFMAKVERMRQGLPFRRTDAQKACRIDVNKASRLYSAYEKVGWLDDNLFTKYL